MAKGNNKKLHSKTEIVNRRIDVANFYVMNDARIN